MPCIFSWLPSKETTEKILAYTGISPEVVTGMARWFDISLDSIQMYLPNLQLLTNRFEIGADIFQLGKQQLHLLIFLVYHAIILI